MLFFRICAPISHSTIWILARLSGSKIRSSIPGASIRVLSVGQCKRGNSDAVNYNYINTWHLNRLCVLIQSHPIHFNWLWRDFEISTESTAHHPQGTEGQSIHNVLEARNQIVIYQGFILSLSLSLDSMTVEIFSFFQLKKRNLVPVFTMGKARTEYQLSVHSKRLGHSSSLVRSSLSTPAMCLCHRSVFVIKCLASLPVVSA